MERVIAFSCVCLFHDMTYKPSPFYTTLFSYHKYLNALNKRTLKFKDVPYSALRSSKSIVKRGISDLFPASTLLPAHALSQSLAFEICFFFAI